MTENKIALSRINRLLQEEYDVFICSASFESRCLSIPKKICKKHFQRVMISQNKDGSESLKKNAQEICSLFKDMTTILEIDLSDPLSFADLFSKELKTIKSKKISVLIDITAFTHETLLVALKLLYLNKSVSSITCVYCNAAAYCPNVEMKNKWLSQGSKPVHSILGYPGILLPSQKNHLILIVGYEYRRAFDLISLVEPSSITLVYANSDNSLTEKDREANAFFEGLVGEMAFEYRNVEHLQLPCNHPAAMAEDLKKLYEKHSDKNIIVIPMNNKMSTIGVFLSVLGCENICVSYAQAIVYNEENYSSPGTQCYILQLK